MIDLKTIHTNAPGIGFPFDWIVNPSKESHKKEGLMLLFSSCLSVILYSISLSHAHILQTYT